MVSTPELGYPPVAGSLTAEDTRNSVGEDCEACARQGRVWSPVAPERIEEIAFSRNALGKVEREGLQWTS